MTINIKRKRENPHIMNMTRVFPEYPAPKQLNCSTFCEIFKEYKFNFSHCKLQKEGNRNAEKGKRLTSGARDY